jgi:uncharacterized membrane protein YeaQ/YmgE (transglycosylase-associated protein family)
LRALYSLSRRILILPVIPVAKTTVEDSFIPVKPFQDGVQAMEIIGLILFAAIGALAGWRAGIFMRSDGSAVWAGVILSALGTAAGGLLFWFLTTKTGGLISSISIAVLVGTVFLYLIGFFNKTRTR